MDFDKEITQLPLLQALHYPIQKFGGFCERFWSLFPTKIADRVYMMADLVDEEVCIHRLLEPEGDEMARENDGWTVPGAVWQHQRGICFVGTPVDWAAQQAFTPKIKFVFFERFV